MITCVDSTGGKKHRVVVRHKSRSRQETIVDNIIFESWTLATDYSTYRLAHTCYIKEINGKKKRIGKTSTISR